MAVWLLSGSAGWAFLGTLVPQEDKGAAVTGAWDAAHPLLSRFVNTLELHRAYEAPVFLAALGVLALSTAVCSWERTRWALRVARGGDSARAAAVRRLASGGGIEVAVPENMDDPLRAVRDALAKRRYRVTQWDGLVMGERARSGLLGSPLFHWSLTLLFVAIAVGQLTQAHGLIGVPVGGSAPNVAQSYGVYRSGALFSKRNTDLTIAVTGLTATNVIDGVDRGFTPTVELRRGDTIVASGQVYPNNPLRYRSLIVHENAHGYSPRVSLLGDTGQVLAEERFLADFSSTTTDGISPVALETVDAGGQNATARAEITVLATSQEIAEQKLPAQPKARIRVMPVGGGQPTVAVLGVGDSIPVPGGELRFDGVEYYARLSVADDWSVYPIYLLFLTATLGLTTAVLLPRRLVWVVLREDAGDRHLRVLVQHQRKDPLFAIQIEDLLAETVGARSNTEEHA